MLGPLIVLFLATLTTSTPDTDTASPAITFTAGDHRWALVQRDGESRRVLRQENLQPAAQSVFSGPQLANTDQHSVLPRAPAVVTSTNTQGFPLPSCYINNDGFMCCSKSLETLMDDTYRKLKASRPDWNIGNIDQVATAVQRAAQKRFNVSFETVTGVADYASKNYFSGDMICKIKRDTS